MTLTPPSKPWLNKDWREYVLSLANEVEQLRAEALLFRHNMSDTYGGSGASSVATSRTFPAVITGSSGGFLPEGGNYVAYEVLRPRNNPWTVPAGDPAEDNTYFFCSNVFEEGLVCGGQQTGQMVIPPSVHYNTHGACFADYTCSAVPIATDALDQTVVVMHAQVCQAPAGSTSGCTSDLYVDRILGPNTFYFFQAQVQPCLVCVEDDPPPGAVEKTTTPSKPTVTGNLIDRKAPGSY
tara:strand:- start:834 stop:1547 length:714 start_codon:yes stop_codon:yes gene_type:complete